MAIRRLPPGRVFDHMPRLSRRFNWTRSDAEDAIASIIHGADHLGTSRDGTAFLLVAVPADLLDWLASVGEDAADLEDGGEDCCTAGDDDPAGATTGRLSDKFAGNPDDAEDDDPAEVSIGWSDGSAPYRPAGLLALVDPTSQLHLSHGVPCHDDLEGEHDGREPEIDEDWHSPVEQVPVIVVGDDGRATLPDGGVMQWQPLPPLPLGA